LLRVVGPAQLAEQDKIDAQSAQSATAVEHEPDDLGAFVQRQWFIFRNARNNGQDTLNNRLLRCQRMFEGKYDPNKLAEINKFGGSQVYTRVVAVKCRGASALLREVYLSGDRPWDIEPQVDPEVPAEIKQQIMQLVNSETQNLAQSGQPIVASQVHMRMTGLMHAAQQAARRQAESQAASAADKIEDILRTGGFYEALREFLTDLPLFPFACIKGPTVRLKPKVVWNNDQADVRQVPTLCWERVSPFDLYWTPGVSDISEADIIERMRLTRSDLNALMGVPGYSETNIRGVLTQYPNGYRGLQDTDDSEQALNENREDPNFNQSGIYDCMAFTGRVQGQTLLNNGVDPDQIPDPDRDYSVQTWVIGTYTLKTQINPSLRQRHPYYVTSFEKVPGTVSGHSLPDLLEDIQEVCNATMRALVNNMAIASGPQVVVNTDAVAPDANVDELFPWKRWYVINDPMAGTQGPPVNFFQPNSNAQELLSVYQQMTTMADEVSAIPRYLTGSSLSGGAGRTASGLSMLMSNAEKVLQTVAANVDADVLEPLLMELYDMIMLTDTTGILTGQEQIRIDGAGVAAQKDTERSKQLQFLQLTGNPIDIQIVGELGRARVLRAVAQGLGLPDDIVPDDQTLQSQIQAKQQMQTAQAALQAASGQGGPQGQPGQTPQGKGGQAAHGQGNQMPQPGPSSASDMAPPVNSFQQGSPVP
jgi:hypothetical protein